MLTLKQAAEQTGKTKQAIQQAIKKGKVSAQKTVSNEWNIDPAELFRVYPPINHVDNKNHQQLDDALQQKTSALHPVYDGKDDKIAMLEGVIADLKADKMFLQEQLKTSSLLIEDMRFKAGNKPLEQRKGFFAWLIGSRA